MTIPASQRPDRTTPQLHAAFSHHPFDRVAAADLGISPERLERACDRGGLLRIGKGWYVINPEGSRRHAAGLDYAIGSTAVARLQVLQAENSGAAACATTSAALLSLSTPPHRVANPEEPEIVFVNGSPGKRGRRLLARARRWNVPEHHVMVGPHGILMTTPLRTAIDLARGLPLPFALVSLDAAMRMEVLDGRVEADVRAELASLLADIHRSHGMKAVAHALPFVEAGAESPLESIVRGRIIEARLPRPTTQVPLVGASGRHYRGDLGLDLPHTPPGTFGLIIEADGMLKYAEERGWLEEKSRQQDLERVGHQFVRVTYVEGVSRPAPFLAHIRKILRD